MLRYRRGRNTSVSHTKHITRSDVRANPDTAGHQVGCTQSSIKASNLHCFVYGLLPLREARSPSPPGAQSNPAALHTEHITRSGVRPDPDTSSNHNGYTQVSMQASNLVTASSMHVYPQRTQQSTSTPENLEAHPPWGPTKNPVVLPHTPIQPNPTKSSRPPLHLGESERLQR